MYIPYISSNIAHAVCRYPIVLLVVTLIGGVLLLPAVLPREEACLTPMVSFTFDDGYKSVLEADEILSKYGFKGVLFVTTDMIGREGFVTVEDIQRLYAHGWEIGSHGKTHTPLVLLPDDEIYTEVLGSRLFLESIGINVHSFASPYGKYNEKTLNWISKYYTIHRTGDFGFNEPASYDRYRLKAIEIKQDTPVQTVKDYIGYAYDNGLWVILIFHRIDNTSEYGYSKDKFEEVVKYVYELKNICR